MLPRNFPGRQNERRKKAIKNLTSEANAEARKRTEERIMPKEVARGVRTKKWRGDRGKLRA